MNGHPLIPTGVVPRLSPAPASETQPPSRAAQAIEQLLEIERKAKAWDALLAQWPPGSAMADLMARMLAETII